MQAWGKLTWTALWTGAVVWLVPFVVAFGFYGPGGKLAVDIFLFKSVMHVVSAAVGGSLLWLVFARVPGSFFLVGSTLGGVWFVVNLGLDALMLLPISGQSWGDWWTQIGLGYLTMPISAMLVGALLRTRARRT